MAATAGPGGRSPGASGRYLVTFSVAVALRTSVLLVPVTVSVNVPFGPALDVLTVRVEELPAGFVPNVTVEPAGAPLAFSVTLPVNPSIGAMLTVYAAVPPRPMMTKVGPTEREKSGDTLVTVTLAVPVMLEQRKVTKVSEVATTTASADPPNAALLSVPAGW